LKEENARLREKLEAMRSTEDYLNQVIKVITTGRDLINYRRNRQVRGTSTRLS